MTDPKVVGSYLRRPYLVGALVALVAGTQGLGLVISRSGAWAGHWPNSSATVGLAAIFGSSVIAAASALVMALPRHGQYRELIAASSRPPMRAYGRVLVSVAAGGAVGYLAVLVYVVSVTAPEATRGRLDPWEVFPLFASIAPAVGVGVLAARFLPPLVAPVVAAAVPYAAFILAYTIDVSTNTWLAGELVPYDEDDRDYLRVPAELLALKGAVALLAGLALIALLLGSRRLGRVALVLSSLALSGLLLIAGVREDVPEAHQAVCTQSVPVVCLDRAHDHLLDEYQDRIGSVVADLAWLDLAEVAFVQSRELISNSAALAGESPDLGGRSVVVAPITKHHVSPAHQFDQRVFIAEFGRSLFVSPCVAGGEAAYLWWLESRGLPTDGSNFAGEGDPRNLVTHELALAAAYGALTAMTDRERDDWLAAQALEAIACRGEPNFE